MGRGRLFSFAQNCKEDTEIMQVINQSGGTVNVENVNEREEAGRAAAVSLPTLGEYNDAVKIILSALRNMGASPERVMDFLNGVYEPFGIPVTEDCEFAGTQKMYTATQIAGSLGLYSMNGYPHAHAVSAILNNNLFIGEEHRAELILFETANLTVYFTRYDKYALERVRNWVETNGLPDEVDGACYTYYIFYKH
jgi:hypothetical protein